MTTNIQLAHEEKAYSLFEPNTKIARMSDAEIDRILAGPDPADALNCTVCGASLRHAAWQRMNDRRCHKCAYGTKKHAYRERGT